MLIILLVQSQTSRSLQTSKQGCMYFFFPADVCTYIYCKYAYLVSAITSIPFMQSLEIYTPRLDVFFFTQQPVHNGSIAAEAILHSLLGTGGL